MTILWRYHLALEFPEEIDALRAELSGCRITVAEERTEFERMLPDADIVVSGPLSAEEVRAAVRMKAHFLPYAGVNALPLADYAERGIVVANSHGNAAIVAERAVTLALAAAGRIVEFHNGLAAGLWARRDGRAQIFEYWRSLQGAECAVIGTGRIGRRIAELLRGFDCTVVGVRRRAAVAGEDGPFTRVTTDGGQAIETAAVVLLAVPLTDETRAMIDAQAISRMNGAILVNVSRGEIIDEHALYRSLCEHAGAGDAAKTSATGPAGRTPARRKPGVAAAGIDCWWRYPDSFTDVQLPSRLPFHRLPNVVMSPHAGSHTVEGKRGQLAETLENIRTYVNSGRPAAAVDLHAGY